jgi:hypothetical protein
MKYLKIYLISFFVIFFGGSIFSQTAYQYIKQGDKSVEIADYYTAVYYFNKAREVDSNIIETDFKIANCFRLMNDYKSAYIYYDKVLKIDKYKNFPLSEFWMGIVSKYLGNYAISKNHFQRFNDRYSYTDYYKSKCIQEINSINWAIQHSIIQPNIDVSRLDEHINSVYTEFAGMEVDDSTYLFSSIRENNLATNNKTKEFSSHIFTLKKSDTKWSENTNMFKWFNNFDNNIANGSFSDDKLRFYFNVCQYINVSELRCDIYLSEYKNGEWQEPVKLNEEINSKGFTNTQPNEGLNKILYFVSDRPNGYGKLDIWYANRNEDGTFSEVKNIGNTINSIDNEITPFYDSNTSRLYFSSDWYEGYGGYDIFYSNYLNSNYSKPLNISLPINSSYNDIYYTINKNNQNIGYFSSNRKGSLFLKGESCCNDIYKFEKKRVTESHSIPLVTIKQNDTTSISINQTKLYPTDSSIKTTITPLDTNTNTTISRLERLLPVTVYFHNDIPNPRSTSDTTVLNYLSTYQEYSLMKKEYIQEYTKVDEKNAPNAINDLFNNRVDEGYKKLLLFSSIMKNALLKGKKIQLTIEGYCSPLALNEYNIHLANRRIASLKNYIASFDNGFYNTYLSNGQLRLVNAPYGEEKAKSGISDDRLDTKNSVYNPNAAIERRVAIIAIDILP